VLHGYTQWFAPPKLKNIPGGKPFFFARSGNMNCLIENNSGFDEIRNNFFLHLFMQQRDTLAIGRYIILPKPNDMKNSLFLKTGMLLLFCLFAFAGYAQDQQETNGPELSFEKSAQDYGTIYVDEMPDGKLDIKFSNTGNEPLVLSNVRACCGTRVTAWPREPLMPGEEGLISIEFRLAPRPQRIGRTVTVTSNQPDRPTSIYRITGQVIERE
jgi:hypothetical protein